MHPTFSCSEFSAVSTFSSSCSLCSSWSDILELIPGNLQPFFFLVLGCLRLFRRVFVRPSMVEVRRPASIAPAIELRKDSMEKRRYGVNGRRTAEQ